MQGWWEFLELKQKEGVKTERVRLVREPLSDYVRWELEIHKQSMQHGDDIRVLTAEKINSSLEALQDFWLIDEHTVLKMQYSPAGEYHGFSASPEMQVALDAKNYLLSNSISLSDFKPSK